MFARGLNLADTLARPLAWSPARLLPGPEHGLLLLPVPGLLFQDAAGLLPAGLPGQPVGLIRRAAGSVDAMQTVSTARPTLGRHPKSGLRNRALRSAEFAQVGAWESTGFTPTFQQVTGDIWGSAIDADMRNFAVYDRTNATWIVPTTSYSAGDGRKSVTFTAPAGCVQANVYPARTSGAGKIIYSHAANSVVIPGQTYTFSWHVAGNSFGGVQVETGAVMTPYQRTTSAYDVTEAGVPDAWYLGLDGVDDFLSSPAFAWGSDEVTVIAAIHKASDAAAGSAISFGAYSANGGWRLSAPRAAGQANFSAYSSAGSQVIIGSAGDTAPITAVIALQAKTQAPLLRLRRNGVLVAESLSGQGLVPTYFNGIPAEIRIGDWHGTDRLNGRLYGLIAINRILNPTELALAERYMANKIGVSLS